MGLMDQAAADLASILSDDVGGFAIPITVIAPNDNTATIKGVAADIGHKIDPETGMMVVGRSAHVTLPIALLRAAGLKNPVGVADDDRHPWRVSFTLPTGAKQTFKVSKSAPDKLGALVCYLESYES